MIKAIYEKLIANMTLNGERLKALALRLGKRQRRLLYVYRFFTTFRQVVERIEMYDTTR